MFYQLFDFDFAEAIAFDRGLMSVLVAIISTAA